MIPIKKEYIQTLTLLIANALTAQNSMVGDGFGGRLWYQPTNFSVGSYSGYSICKTGGASNSNQLYSWGANVNKQLGIGSDTIGIAVPTTVIGMTDVRYVSAGYLAGAIKNDSTGWMWGFQDGSGYWYPKFGNIPQKIISNVKFLNLGALTASFIKNDGTVWGVGNNTWGSLGDGSIVGDGSMNDPTIPVKMLGISNAVRVANSTGTTIILLADGTVKSVGKNNYDNFNGVKYEMLGIGDSSIDRSLTPVDVVGLTRIVDIKANGYAFLALDGDGDVYAWGAGYYIGDGDNTRVDKPKKITALSNIVAISGGGDGRHFLALDANKNCYAWGINGWGQFGVGTIDILLTDILLSPILVATDVIDIMAGETFSYIVKSDSSLWCSGMCTWGSTWLNLSNEQRLIFTKIEPNCPIDLLFSPNGNITTAKCGDLFVPNAFSPNEDGINDVLDIKMQPNCGSEYSLLIFDRWGNKVFESMDLTKPWDGTYKGKALDNAVFMYTLSMTLVNADTPITKKGNVSIVR